MQIFFSIIGIIITIFFVIGTHEAAHFAMARFFGVKVLRFSIGFGKTLFKRRDCQGTEYVLALIPLGGYVKMLDEHEGPVAEHEKHRAYNRLSFYKKFLIVLAGPITNILCAFILYWIIFMIGFTTIKPIIGNVAPNSIAAQAGLQANQEIISIDARPVSTWMNIIFRVISHAGTQDKLTVVAQQANANPKSYTLNISTWRMDDLNPDPLSSLGITPYFPNIPLIIGTISPNSPASGVLAINDKLLAINQVPIKSWDNLINYVNAHPNQTITLTLMRQNKIQNISITIGSKRNLLLTTHGYLGIAPNFVIPPSLLRTIQFKPLEAFVRAGEEIYDFTALNLILFGKIITGKISLQSLGGPITLFESAGNALNVGVIPFLGFLAFLSICIGVVNLLPIPGLDGGHLLFQIIETIIRRPIPERLLTGFYFFGMSLLFFLLIQALVNDISRLH